MPTERTICPLTLSATDQQEVARYMMTVPSSPLAPRREETPTLFRRSNAELAVAQLGGGTKHYSVCVVDSTPEHVHLLVGSFIYQSVICTITAKAADSEQIMLGGQTGPCVFISGRVHLVPIVLNSSLDISGLIDL